jgi:hypothetical protein
MVNAYVVDIDGTIADASHRLHFIDRQRNEPPRWDDFFGACSNDQPITAVIDLLQKLNEGAFLCNPEQDTIFIYLTGRPERIRQQTEQWLMFHNCPNGALLMRADGDHRPDHEIKPERLKGLMDKYSILGVFEDRPSVCREWRKMGLTVFQVGSGEEF